ncbi:MAG: hypothetical protein KGM95_00500, partial [Betaproteobacteria bacterium]|nr:hypothetical protein [Betaproteobacteria bacterium]
DPSVCREQVGDILRRAGYCSYVRILGDALKSEGPATIQLYLFYVHADCLSTAQSDKGQVKGR